MKKTGYWKNGKKAWEEHRNNKDVLHRLKGPAITTWYSTGPICTESYYVNGKNTNNKLPVHIMYYEDGYSIIQEKYIVDELSITINYEKKSLRLVEPTQKISKTIYDKNEIITFIKQRNNKECDDFIDFLKSKEVI